MKENQTKLQQLSAEWENEEPILQKEQQIRIAKAKYMEDKTKKSTTKMLMLFLFVSCSVIELFTMGIMLQQLYLAYTVGYSPDFSPLTTLIGAIVSEVIGFAIYAIKAMKENTQGGVTYLKAEKELEKQAKLEDDSALAAG